MQMAGLGLLDIYHMSAFPFLSINAIRMNLSFRAVNGEEATDTEGGPRGVYTLGFTKYRD